MKEYRIIGERTHDESFVRVLFAKTDSDVWAKTIVELLNGSEMGRTFKFRYVLTIQK